MKDMGIVQGSVAQAVPLIVGKDTVYVHTNIERLPPNDEHDETERYQYHEIQYDKDEYIHYMNEKIALTEQQLTDTQLALCEVYQMIGG